MGRLPDDAPPQPPYSVNELKIHIIHEQFMRGEISQGRMAELLEINRADLIHLLETLGLSVTNL